MMNVANKAGETPLHVAARLGHDELVECCIQQSASPRAADHTGNMPLHGAVVGRHRECAHLLLECDCDIMARNNRKESPYALSVGEIATIMRAYQRANAAKVAVHAMSRPQRQAGGHKNGYSGSPEQGKAGTAKRARRGETPPRQEQAMPVSRSAAKDRGVPDDVGGLMEMIHEEVGAVRKALSGHIQDMKQLILDFEEDLADADSE